MKISKDASLLSPSRLAARFALKGAAGAAGAAMLALVAYSAIIAKEARSAPLLASVSAVRAADYTTIVTVERPATTARWPSIEIRPLLETTVVAEPPAHAEPAAQAPAQPAPTAEPPIDPLSTDPNVRWFNGRPVKPVKVISMVVTAYSPDARSCGDSADGITATLHSVETNGFKLVAADPRVLAYGSMITVPGYDSERIVPVLDCGGAIKGRRLDVLFPTHEAARKWGVRKVPVTVWGYVDGKPAENPRRER